MFRFLYRLYFIIFTLKHFDKLWERILVRFNNFVSPVYFCLTGFCPSNKLTAGNKSEDLIIVSLTSFPARISKVWLTIETILRQKVKPDRLILWLYHGDFTSKEALPKKLRKLEKRGLEIRFSDENLMPHLKYFYAMMEFQDALIITIDDDMFYPYTLIEKLLKCHKTYPGFIISTLTRQIEINGEDFMPYNEWSYMHENTGPLLTNLNMGVGGVLYPKGSVHHDAFDFDALKKMALKTDDIWLKVMSLKCNKGIVSIAGEYPRFFMPVLIKNNVCLMNDNIGQGKNVIVFKNLMDHYKLPMSVFNEDNN